MFSGPTVISSPCRPLFLAQKILETNPVSDISLQIDYHLQWRTRLTDDHNLWQLSILFSMALTRSANSSAIAHLLEGWAAQVPLKHCVRLRHAISCHPSGFDNLVVNVIQTLCRQYGVKHRQVLQLEPHLWLRRDCFSIRTYSALRQDTIWYGEQGVTIRKFANRYEQEVRRKA